MYPVIPPIKPNDSGAPVQNLHQALMVFIKHSKDAFLLKLLVNPAFITAINNEVETQIYGRATIELVRRFQKAMHIDTTDNQSGKVDEATARRLNESLKEW